MLCGLTSSFPAATAAAAVLPSPDGEATVRAATDSAAATIDFDIPAQALAAALDRFSTLSGRSALFSSALAAERTSSPVRGRYTPRQALQLLLDGTGLTIEEISAGRITTFVLKPAIAEAGSSASAPATLSREDDYDGLIQARVWDGICADARTASGSYRALVRFHVQASGLIAQARLVSSSGDPIRDDALIAVLQHTHIGQTPPPEMRQPVTMVIFPERAGGPVCRETRH